MRSTFFTKLVNGPFGDPALYLRLAHSREALLFDCGELHRLSPREILKITSLFISHAHIDHLVGFDTLLRLFLCRPQPLKVFGPPGIIDRIGNRLAGYTWNLTEGYPFVIEVFECGGEQLAHAVFRASCEFNREDMGDIFALDTILKTPSYRVRSVSLDHGGLTSMAYSVEEPCHVAIHKDALQREGFLPGPWLSRFKELVREECLEMPVSARRLSGKETIMTAGDLLKRIAHLERGMKISYVTDVSPTEVNFKKIVKLVAGSHLLAIEATFSHNDLQRAEERGHLTARQAGETGRLAGAMKLLVFHHSPRYRENPHALSEEALLSFFAEGG